MYEFRARPMALSWELAIVGSGLLDFPLLNNNLAMCLSWAAPGARIIARAGRLCDRCVGGYQLPQLRYTGAAIGSRLQAQRPYARIGRVRVTPVTRTSGLSNARRNALERIRSLE